MERRLLIVFALTFLVIMLFQPLLKKYGPQPPAKTDTAAEHSAGQPATAVPTQSLAQQRTPDFVAQGIKVGRESAPRQATSESETVIENDVYRIVFTNRGARVKSWVLKKYTDDKGGQLELVNAVAAEKYGYPLTLWTYDESLRNKINSALYATPAPAASNAAAPPTEVKFVYDDGDVSVQKTFTFDRTSYVIGTQ